MKRLLGFLWITLLAALVAGCPAPAPRPEPAPEPEPAPPPWEKPVPAGVELSIDAQGTVLLGGRPVERLRMVLLDMTESELRQDAAVRITVASQAPWRAAHRVLQACAGAGLRNLHWQVAADERPPAYWPLPARGTARTKRRSVVRVLWDGAEASYTWRAIPAQRGGPEPYLSRARVVAKVRAHRSRRVILAFPPGVPFEVVYETGQALRGTGVSLELVLTAQ